MPENHVFISYAHIDNQPLPERPKGWVSYFDEALTNLLSQKIGESAKVWRDPRMTRDTIFDQEIFNNLLHSLTLVSVVSPRYVESDYCLKELEEFRQKIPPVGARSRVFKVVKTPLRLEEMPEIFRMINGFEFYVVDQETKRPRELGLEFGETLKQEFFLRVSDLAYEIADLINQIEETRQQPTADEETGVKPPSGPAVYLAETSADFQTERDNIRRDLLERNFELFPPSDAVVPKTTEKYKDFVREYIRKCNLSVHLVGKNYGERPEDGDESYIHLQSIVASERDPDPNFSRIVWIPKDVNVDQPRHKAFVDELWASTAYGVEVYEKPLEDLKTNIQDALNRKVKLAQQPKQIAAKPSILVLYDKTDVEPAVAVESRIRDRGFNIRSAAKYLTSEPKELIEAQNDYLRTCDAVLIYWKNSRDSWVWSMLQRLQKILGDGREEPFLGEGVFVDGNNAGDVADGSEAVVVANFDELDKFLESVRNAFQTRAGKGD